MRNRIKENKYILVNEKSMIQLLSVIEELLTHIDHSAFYTEFNARLRDILITKDFHKVDNLVKLITELKNRTQDFISEDRIKLRMQKENK